MSIAYILVLQCNLSFKKKINNQNKQTYMTLGYFIDLNIINSNFFFTFTSYKCMMSCDTEAVLSTGQS